MKRLTAFLLAMVIVLGIMPITTAFAGEYSTELEITFKINSKWQTDMDLKLWVVKRADYHILAPARQLAEKLGAEVAWDDEKQQVTLTRGDKSVSMVIGSSTGMNNGVEKELFAAADMIDGLAYVPVEFVGEGLDYHAFREKYGRQVRLVQKTTTETPNAYQEIKPGTAPLVSTYHRPVPTEFEKSSDPNDLIFYTDYEWIDPDILNAERTLDTSNLPSGEIIYDMDDIFESTPDGERSDAGWWKQVEIDDPNVPFDKVLRIASTKTQTEQTNYIIKPSKRIQEFVGIKEKFLVSFYVRLVEGGHVDTGLGKIFVHIEESYIPKWNKSLKEYIEFSDQWQKVYFLATGVENANHIGFTTGFWSQVVDIGGFQVEKLDPDVDTSMFDAVKKVTDGLTPWFAKEAPWRQEALDRIEVVRKGDFSVVVKDKNGNPVEGAEVELDMFEHEFRFGAVLDTSFYESSIGWAEEYVKTLGVNFNAAGAGNATKEGHFLSNPSRAKRKFGDAKNLGIKYFRGHVLWMPQLQEGIIRPFRLYGPGQGDNLDWDTFEKYVKNSFNEFMSTMDEITELEVANEMTTRITWDNNFSKYGYPGKEYLHQLFFWADEIRKKNNYDHITLCYCGNNVEAEKYWDMLDGFQKANLPFERYMYQGHSSENSARNIGFLNEVYDRYVYEYEKQYGISEYSVTSNTQEFQADATRDALILNFSHPGCESFSVFWYSDVYSGGTSKALEGCAPLYDVNFKEKLGLKTWQDMLYNKWWTRDAKATTGVDGKGTVRGFYGDYDITVRVNGQVVATDMAAFHKGYENVYEITLQ